MRLFDCRQEPDKKQHNIAALEKRPRSEAYFTNRLAPAVGFEPTTNRLTADRSTTELRWIFSVAVGERISCLRDLWRQVLLRAKNYRCEQRLLQQHHYRNLVAGAGFEPAAFRL